MAVHPAVNTEAQGQSDSFLEFQEHLSRVAPIDRPVLILGERGTGKELAATRLHYLSLRWQGPFVALNCSALTPSLIESELFGHEKGAFTGAVARRPGRFESAAGGTLFLDEIGALPMEVQEKILRVVEYGVFERVGSAVPVEVDVRIVGATHEDLPGLADRGRFKQDLLDRLSFDVLFLPPLRRRKGDVRLLAEHFARQMALELGRTETPAFSQSALDALDNHSWPGNIRELKNVVERAVYRSDAGLITDIVFDPFQSPFAPAHAPAHTPLPPSFDRERQAPTADDLLSLPLKKAVATLQTRMIINALRESNYNQKKAARRLGLTYDQFRGLKRKHGHALN